MESKIPNSSLSTRFWLICNNVCDFINATEVQPAIRTDHAAITLALGDIGEIKGPGIWKMNVSLLEDENYLEQLRINIPKWKQEGEIDLSDKRCVWGWIKYILDCTPLATPKKKPNLNMRKSSGFNKNLTMLTGCLKMTLVPQIDCD